MAESNFSTPVYNPFSMPTPVGPHAQGPQTLAPPVIQPTFSDLNTWSDYHHFNPHYTSQMSDPNQDHRGSFHYMPYNRVSPYQQQGSHFAGPRVGHYPSPDMFPNGPGAPSAQGPSLSPFHSMHIPSGPPDFGESRNNSDTLPRLEPTMTGSHGFSLPPYSQLASPQMHGYSPYQGRRSGPALPTPPALPPGRFGADRMQSSSHGRGPSGGFNSGVSGSPRVISPPSRRAAYERPQQNVLQAPGAPERRQSLLGTNNRRSDRSVSPRTSHRRSFDRYATDLPHSDSSFESDAAASRARLHRVRQHRRAMFGGGDFRRAYASIDSNTPTAAQIQALKDKIRHFLPSELPEGSSTSCDICQKDFSNKHVDPTEEDEVAVQLPCKHVFGEHCFNTWIETCQKHKNKITCPMCRKLLVEPVQRGPAAMMAAMPEMMSLLTGGQLDRRTLDSWSQADRQVLERVMGPLEGDFPHV